MKDDFFRANPISLDPDNPLYQQLYTHLQTAVLTGDLTPGMRLPSTRALAILLNVSRHTVLNAYQQLIAEGYLVSMSLDGFVTAANVRPEAGLGDGGERLHDWAFNSADRAIVNSWQKERAWVRLFLADITMIWRYPIGEQMGPPAMPGYQRSLFHTVFPKTYPMEVYIVSPMALRLRLKKHRKRQVIKMSRSTSSLCCLAAAFDCLSTWTASMSSSKRWK